MPCVLTRLRDNDPDSRRESFSRSVSLAELRESILENIRLIFHSRFRPEAGELGDDPRLMSSVLGLGLSDFCGMARSDENRARLREDIIRQLRWFEPRLDPETLEVEVRDGSKRDGSGWALVITGRISVAPLSGEMLCVSEIDLETGTVEVR